MSAQKDKNSRFMCCIFVSKRDWIEQKGMDLQPLNLFIKLPDIAEFIFIRWEGMKKEVKKVTSS